MRRHCIDVGRLHIFWSDRVSWKQGFFNAQVVEHNAYPQWGRDRIESGERLNYRCDYIVVGFKVGTRGLCFHWWPIKGRLRPTEAQRVSR